MLIYGDKMKTEKELMKEFNQELKSKTLSVFDDCIECNNEGRLVRGLCFKCWCKYIKGII